jgi:hypothetical protein
MVMTISSEEEALDLLKRWVVRNRMDADSILERFRHEYNYKMPRYMVERFILDRGKNKKEKQKEEAKANKYIETQGQYTTAAIKTQAKEIDWDHLLPERNRARRRQVYEIQGDALDLVAANYKAALDLVGTRKARLFELSELQKLAVNSLKTVITKEGVTQAGVTGRVLNPNFDPVRLKTVTNLLDTIARIMGTEMKTVYDYLDNPYRAAVEDMERNIQTERDMAGIEDHELLNPAGVQYSFTMLEPLQATDITQFQTSA